MKKKKSNKDIPPFAKILMVDGRQVLITKEDIEEDTPDAPYGVRIRTDFDGYSAQATLSFETEEKRTTGFIDFTETMATGFVTEFEKFNQ